MKTQLIRFIRTPVAIGALFLITAFSGFGAAETVIPFAAKLTDKDGKVIDGQRTLTFKLYSVPQGGTALWTEGYQNSPVSKGIASVNLGAVSNLNVTNVTLAEELWLGITIPPDAEMTPRIRVPSQRAIIPKGVIVMWAGSISDIRPDWALCDGANGTPDLRDRFVVGAKQDSGGVAKSNLEGSLNQSGGDAKQPPETQKSTLLGVGKFVGGGGDPDTIHRTHTHPFVPPYFALAYIMKR